MTNLRSRLDRHRLVARALNEMTDDELGDLVEQAPLIGTGIGGSSRRLQVAGEAVFVKQVPLTDVERQPRHVRSTANIFDLPSWCHYGVGAPSFGAWRELAAHDLTTDWVVTERLSTFPLLHHWRQLEGPAFPGALPDDLANVEGIVAFWHGSEAVRIRLEAIATSTANITLFLEHLPATLPEWLATEVSRRDDRATEALGMVERALRRDVAAMNGRGLFHFDAHLDNILTDGQRLYLADFGLALSLQFELSPDERTFLEANRTHDVCHTITRFVDWLVTNLAGVADWRDRDEYIRRCAAGHEPREVSFPAAEAIISRYAPVAVVINEFYARLHLEDRRTPYPASAIAIT